MNIVIQAWLIAAVLGLVLCGIARPVLRRMGVIDKPNARSSHTVPTVRGLGVGIVAAIVAGWTLAGLEANPVVIVLTIAGLILSVVSFIDDMRPLSSKLRFCCHALAAIAFLTVLVNYWGDAPAPLLLAGILPVGFLFVAGYTNAFNFMDGINGIAGGQALFTGLGSVIVLLLSGVPVDSPVVLAFAVISGACGGFLPHNFPKAKGFMGDVASATLGYWLSACVLWAVAAYGWALLIPLALLHANFILDTGFTLVRRARRGDKLSDPHREHFYQRMVRSGASHATTTGLESAGLLVSIGLMSAYVVGGPIVKVATTLVLLALWCGFFVYAERRFDAFNRRHVG